jgi:hypothetical protein
MLKQLCLSLIHFNTVLRKKDKSQMSENRVLGNMSRAKKNEESRPQDVITQGRTFITTMGQLALRFGRKISESEPSSSDGST